MTHNDLNSDLCSAAAGPEQQTQTQTRQRANPNTNTRLSAGRGGWGAPIETTQSLLLDLVTRPIVQICIYGNNGMLTRRRLGRLALTNKSSTKTIALLLALLLGAGAPHEVNHEGLTPVADWHTT